MNVLLLTEHWPPRVGGIERYLTNIVEHFSAGKMDVIAPRERRHADVQDQRSTDEHVIKKRFFWPALKPAWAPLFLHVLVRRIRGEFDVLLCGKPMFEGVLAYYLHMLTRTPYVVCTYGMEVATWNLIRKERNKLRKVLRRASAITYINEQTRTLLLELGARDSQLVEVLPGVDDAYCRVAHTDGTRQQHQASTEEDLPRPYIFAVGRLIARKGFDDLVRAYYLLPEDIIRTYDLVIAGDGPTLRELEQLSGSLHKKHGIWSKKDPHVHLLGSVSESRLRTLYAGASVFALTPKNIDGDIEGFGIVYLEAASFGVPVVGTRSGGVEGAVVDAQTGIVVHEHSPEEVRDALARLLTDTKLAKSMGERGKKRVQKLFCWDTRIRPLERTLRNCV